MSSLSSSTKRERRKSVLFTLVKPLRLDRKPRANTLPVQNSIATCGFQRGSVLLPPIVEQTCCFLEQHALLQEGLFRITGAQEDVRYIKDKFEKGRKVKLSKVSLDTVAGVLKLFFMELPNPVLTFELYGSFLAATSIRNELLRVWCVKRVVDILPPGNKAVLDRVCAMFRCIANLQENNKMSAKNIALVMSSSFLRDRNETAEEMLRTGGLRVRLMSFDDFEENFKKIDGLTLEVELQLQKFEGVLQQDSQKLSATLNTEGEVDIVIKLEERKPLKGKLFGNDEIEEPTASMEMIDGELTPKSRRRGFRCNKIDMESAFQNFNLPPLDHQVNLQVHPSELGDDTEMFSVNYTHTGSYLKEPEVRENARRKRPSRSGTKRKRKSNAKTNKKKDTKSTSILALAL